MHISLLLSRRQTYIANHFKRLIHTVLHLPGTIEPIVDLALLYIINATLVRNTEQIIRLRTKQMLILVRFQAMDNLYDRILELC